MNNKTFSFTAPYAALLLLLSLMLVTVPTHAGDKINLLVMSEDADDDTVPRNSRVFRRVITAIQNQMLEQNIDVIDETMATLDEFEQGRTRRSRAEIMDIARSISKPPIDVVTNFLIYASVEDKGYTSRLHIRVEGEILHVGSRKYLGNFEQMSPRNWNITPKCAKSRECVLEQVGAKSRILGNDIGAVLAEKLAYLRGDDRYHGGKKGGFDELETAYELIFDGFTPEDMLDIEEYLVIFSGYQSHRPTYSGARRAELWYESTINSAKLDRNLKKMLEQLELRATVQFSANKFVIKKITFRGKAKKPVGDDW